MEEDDRAVAGLVDRIFPAGRSAQSSAAAARARRGSRALIRLVSAGGSGGEGGVATEEGAADEAAAAAAQEQQQEQKGGDAEGEDSRLNGVLASVGAWASPSPAKRRRVAPPSTAAAGSGTGPAHAAPFGSPLPAAGREELVAAQTMTALATPQRAPASGEGHPSSGRTPYGFLSGGGQAAPAAGSGASASAGAAWTPAGGESTERGQGMEEEEEEEAEEGTRGADLSTRREVSHRMNEVIASVPGVNKPATALLSPPRARPTSRGAEDGGSGKGEAAKGDGVPAGPKAAAFAAGSFSMAQGSERIGRDESLTRMNKRCAPSPLPSPSL